MVLGCVRGGHDECLAVEGPALPGAPDEWRAVPAMGVAGSARVHVPRCGCPAGPGCCAARRVAAAQAMSLAELIRDAERRDPAEVLLSATHVADAIVTKMVDALEGREPVTPEMVASLAEAIKLAAQMAKLAIDAAGPQLEAQRERIARQHLAPQIAAVFGRFVEALGLTPEQTARVPAAVEAAVRGFLAEAERQPAVGSQGRRALPAGRGSR